MPAARPKTDVDEEVAPETKVDEGLAKLYETYQKRESIANLQFVDVIEYVKKNNLKRAVVKLTLESRGLSPSSVSSEVSRIMSMIKPENAPVLAKLADNEITIAAARKAVATPQQNPAKSPTDKLWEMLYKAARYEYKAAAEHEDFTLQYFTSEAANAWNQVKDEEEAKEKEAQEAEEQATETEEVTA